MKMTKTYTSIVKKSVCIVDESDLVIFEKNSDYIDIITTLLSA
jgi:hypothetical protein